MKMLPLTELVSRPQAVKKLTARGQTVTITEEGKALWVLKAIESVQNSDSDDKAARDEWLDAEMDRMLKEAKTGVSATQLILESRR
ncbi:MAG TPA: hypothetical protein DDZ88_29305 [Verrucomicrobiales bacterium]|nr:hypothetical protein [Verrucomicrobiales bacterium]